MNVIVVLIDSLNRQYLSAYGPSAVATPHLDAFARRAWRFDSHFVGSLPCMPARREIFAGTAEFLWRPWGPLEPFDARLPRLLEAAGYTTAIVTDHYHYWEEEANGYVQAFQSSTLVRGHEIDRWRAPLASDAPIPAWVQNIERWRPGWGRRYWSNVRDFDTEEDFFPAKVMMGARHWLEKNSASAPFFLQVESFDVHEPFHVPEPYASLYGDGTLRDRFTVWPPYQDTRQLARFMETTSDAELAFIRAQYAGKLTMVDRWFGELIGTLDRLALWDTTAVIVTTDHGHDLGERGTFGKQFPHFDSHAHIPLLLWCPGLPGNGQQISSLTSTIDLFATILDLAGVPVPGATPSQSILPLLTDGSASIHDALLYGTFGQGICCTDREWTLIKSPARTGPLYSYSSLLFQSLTADTLHHPVSSGYVIPYADLPQWQVPVQAQPLSRENFLFHRDTDPGQMHNLWTGEVDARERMVSIVLGLLEHADAPPEQYIRLGLDT